MNRLREKTTATLLIAIFMISAITIVVPKRVVANGSGPIIDYFQLIYHISNEPDGRNTWGYSINGWIYNPDDTVIDGNIQGLYENEEFLVDVITTDPEGEKYSIINGIYDYKIRSEPNREYLEFWLWRHFIEPQPPVGTYVTELITLGEEILDSVTLTTPYTDEEGKPYIPIRFPDFKYPINGQTKVDTPPTFTWEPFELHEEADDLEWSIYMWWGDFNEGNPPTYMWNINSCYDSSIEDYKVSFPDAPEIPGSPPQKTAPPGEEFPTELSPGTYYINLVTREWFL